MNRRHFLASLAGLAGGLVLPYEPKRIYSFGEGVARLGDVVREDLVWTGQLDRRTRSCGLRLTNLDTGEIIVMTPIDPNAPVIPVGSWWITRGGEPIAMKLDAKETR